MAGLMGVRWMLCWLIKMMRVENMLRRLPDHEGQVCVA